MFHAPTWDTSRFNTDKLLRCVRTSSFHLCTQWQAIASEHSVYRHSSMNVAERLSLICDFFPLFLLLLRSIFLISTFHVQLIYYFYVFEVCLWKLDYWKFVGWPIYPLNPILHLRCSWKYQPRASAGQSTSHCESRSQTSNHTSAHQRGTSGHQCNMCSSKCL